jgi:hypothetical protein
MSVTTSLYRHRAPHRELARRYRHHFSRSDFRFAALVSVVGFVAASVVSFYAIRYATEHASSPVTDLVLSNVRAYDVDALFALGTIFLFVFAALLLLAHPKRIPYALNTMALFYFIRSTLVTLTHIGPFPVQTPEADWGTLLNHFLFSSDLFFSGHVGVTFLLALVFWEERILRHIFLTWSVFFSAVVLLGHLHYSIDVVSAYFITYTIFCISKWLFPKSREIFFADEPLAAA